jgi:starch phosphorylase
MNTKGMIVLEVIKVAPRTPEEWRVSELLKQYGCGPIAFFASENAFYERHLVFDRIINPRIATARERFEAFSHSIREILAQRWVLTRSAYNQTTPRPI